MCGTIFRMKTNVFLRKTKADKMSKKSKYYVVKEKAVPEVLLKVVEAKKLMETRKAATIQEAVDMTGKNMIK